MIKRIFDIGMYDGTDSAYYLESGYQVVAVEANPELTESAARKFSTQLASGQLVCVNAAISPDGKPVELNLCGQDLGSSSLLIEQIAQKRPVGTVTVPGVTMQELLDRYGLPEYLKVDIEGADRLCILPLTADRRPNFLSFEVGKDVDELIEHVLRIGYRRFKIINQTTFRELGNRWCLQDRLRWRLMRVLGYSEPQYIRRAGRFFWAGHSSGPVPWHSDGQWRSGEATRSRLRDAKGTLSGWHDIHTALT